MDNASYNVRTNISYTKATNPGTVTFVPGADAVALSQEKVNHYVAAELFQTQEGVVFALRKSIIVNVPEDIIIELKVPEYDYKNYILALFSTTSSPTPSRNASSTPSS